MIRTLRRKFILVNMLLVSLVLLMVFGVFMASSAQRLKDQSLLAMRAALMWGEEGSPLRPEIAFPLDGSRRPSSGQGAQRSLLPVFTVTVEDGVVTAHTTGTARITATSYNGLTSTCTVTVVQAAGRIAALYERECQA